MIYRTAVRTARHSVRFDEFTSRIGIYTSAVNERCVAFLHSYWRLWFMYHNTVRIVSYTTQVHVRISRLYTRSRFTCRIVWICERLRGKISVRWQMFETRCRGLARFLPRSLSLSLSPFTPLQLCALFLLYSLISQYISSNPLEEFRNRYKIRTKLILLW